MDQYNELIEMRTRFMLISCNLKNKNHIKYSKYFFQTIMFLYVWAVTGVRGKRNTKPSYCMLSIIRISIRMKIPHITRLNPAVENPWQSIWNPLSKPQWGLPCEKLCCEEHLLGQGGVLSPYRDVTPPSRPYWDSVAALGHSLLTISRAQTHKYGNME